MRSTQTTRPPVLGSQRTDCCRTPDRPVRPARAGCLIRAAHGSIRPGPGARTHRASLCNIGVDGATMNLYTIGFTRKSAETFFTRLKRAGVKRLIDVRLNNVSQLAGFAKRDDLRYFTRAICDADYLHAVELAPTQAMLDDYRRKNGDWTAYERAFRGLLAERRIERTLAPELLDRRVPAVQRGPAAPLPPARDSGVSERALGRRQDRASVIPRVVRYA